ncbi:MAG: cell division protein ZipA C-terminal FtsZ-binding domain-containing protein [Chromatiales bacterium]|nr:cell division protein ZipA C-terminal FtsZ-binding domain-containing protein [Chromatiales bacterium]
MLPEKIVTIRILSRAGAPFRAEDLILALREAGLRHGRFGIFHAHVSDADDTPVFSVASLTEPGSFDLTRVHTDVYQGVSLFLGLPGPVEGVTAFESMVNAARAVAKRLDGNLVDEHGSTLSVQRERYLREEVIQFQHRQGRPA